MRFASLLVLAVAMSTDAARAAAISTPPIANDAPSLDSPFSVTSHTQIPGVTLKPGKYTIAIKDHLTDRLILQVTNSTGKVESTFLGVFRSDLATTKAQGPIAVPSEKPSDALLGFTFPGGRTVEFVYPKAEAADLTSRTPGEILAIDPPSDNLKSSGSQLSKQDAAIVTLWSLQVTPVSAGQKGISAKKYQTTEEKQPIVAGDTSRPGSSVKRPAPASQALAAANRVPAIKALPHTASNMPLLLLFTAVSMSLAAGIRFKRNMSHVG